MIMTILAASAIPRQRLDVLIHVRGVNDLIVSGSTSERLYE